MSAITYDNRTAFTYQLRLPTFEGPLDLLLKLIDRQQLPISEVSLVTVSEQFLEFAGDRAGRAPETIAEFTAVGSRLVAMKARSLLPRPPIDIEESDPDDLVTQLLEYQAFKAAAEQFGHLDQCGANSYIRGPQAVDLPEWPANQPLAQHEASQLVRALRRCLGVTSAVKRLVTVRPTVTLREMANWLLVSIRFGPASFHAIASGPGSGSGDQRALFLALLVLIRRGMVNAEQAAPFGDITISQADPARTISTNDLEEF